jgi:hypothetical protein
MLVASHTHENNRLGDRDDIGAFFPGFVELFGSSPVAGGARDAPADGVEMDLPWLMVRDMQGAWAAVYVRVMPKLNHI